MGNKRVIERLGSLINVGEKVVQEAAAFYQWRTSSLALLGSVLGYNSIHYREFDRHCVCSIGYYETESGLAILRAAKEDIKGGYLQKVETLVSASVFSDFLEMAEHLLDNGYEHPAASLVGAVLEDSLRRICTSNGITLKTKEDISSLNQKLAQKQVYNPLQQKQIQVWNDIRNNADHGHFDQYKSDDVTDMLKGVRTFLTNYLK